ncbi:MAG: NAD-dependent epimerase/dehydratase family protein [Gemmatimonadales bacterium]
MSIVAVTGAAGRIGAPLVRALVESGHRVRALSRRARPAITGVDWVTGDLLDDDALAHLVNGAATVFHAAGQLDGDALAVRASLVDGTARVLRAAQQIRTVHLSSLVVLCTARRELDPIDEHSPLEPVPERRGTYTQAKCAAEAIAREAARTQDVVVVRPGLVLARRMELPPSVGWRRGRRIWLAGAAGASLPAVNPTDVASGLAIAAAQLRSGEILHLVDPEPPSRMELLRWITGSESGIAAIRSGGVALRLAALAAVSRLPVVSAAGYRLRSAATPHRWSVERAVALGWKPRGWRISGS